MNTESYKFLNPCKDGCSDIVVSEKSFTKLNSWLRSFNIVVEEINFKEISKQGGLLRCSTLPLTRA